MVGKARVLLTTITTQKWHPLALAVALAVANAKGRKETNDLCYVSIKS